MPVIFQYWLVQWIPIILLSLLLPIGFAKSLKEYYQSATESLKSIVTPLSFLGIFLISLSWPLATTHAFTAMIYNPTRSSMDLLEGLYSMEDVKKREFVAKIIFEEYGQKVPYKDTQNEFIVFEPNDENKIMWENKRELKKESEELQTMLSDNSLKAFNISMIQILLFFIFFSVALLLENEKITNKDRL